MLVSSASAQGAPFHHVLGGSRRKSFIERMLDFWHTQVVFVGTVLVLSASTHVLGCSRFMCLDAVDFRVLLNICWMCEKRFKTEREAARARAERSVAEVG